MAIVLLRTVILYFCVLFTIRIMGKSELSEMSPFQLVVVFMIAELAAIPIETPTASLLNGVAAIFALMFLQTLLSTVSIKCEWFKNLINGHPSILIEDGVINKKELRSLRITLNDLMEQLRIQNVQAVSDVAYAIMEANGELSVILKPEKRPLTFSDLGVSADSDALPLVLISDGIIFGKNMDKLNVSENRLSSILKQHGLKGPEDVFLAFSDQNKSLHVYTCDPSNENAREVFTCAIS